MRYHEPDLSHIAHEIANLDAITDAESAPIGHRVPGYNIGQQRGRAERKENSKENCDSLEGFRPRPREVGVTNHGCERDDQHAYDVVNRYST